MDKCLYMLLKFARDKGFERLVKLEKGKLSGRIKATLQRHHASKSLPFRSVTKTDEYTWQVVSSGGRRSYTVVREEQVCPMNCYLRCSLCNICVHLYSCNCMDCLIHNTICKHIHMIAKYQCSILPDNDHVISDKTNNNNTTNDSNGTGTVESATSFILNTLQHKERMDHNLSNVRLRLTNKLSILTTQILYCNELDTLLAAEKHINSATHLIQAMTTYPNTTYECTTPEPPNKNIQPQRPFYSTKKKRATSTIRLAKPTEEEKEKVRDALLTDHNMYAVQASDPGLRRIMREL